MSDLVTTIDTHLEAYCEPDAARRAELIARVWADDGQLVDPPIDGVGHDAIGAMADAVLAHYADHTFRRTTGVDEHHDMARYAWELVAPDGEVVLGGTDIAQVDADGKLVRITGFFGDPPAREA